jgi:hypothetical protein
MASLPTLTDGIALTHVWVGFTWLVVAAGW